MKQSRGGKEKGFDVMKTNIKEKIRKEPLVMEYYPLTKQITLTRSCPGTGRAVVKIGHSNLWPVSKESRLMVCHSLRPNVFLCFVFVFPIVA